MLKGKPAANFARLCKKGYCFRWKLQLAFRASCRKGKPRPVDGVLIVYCEAFLCAGVKKKYFCKAGDVPGGNQCVPLQEYQHNGGRAVIFYGGNEGEIRSA